MSFVENNISAPNLQEEFLYHSSEAKYHLDQWLNASEEAERHYEKWREHNSYKNEFKAKIWGWDNVEV